MIVLDTSVVVAFMNGRDDRHAEVRRWMDGVADELVTTPLAVAEMDFLVSSRGGAPAARALRESFASGAYLVEWWPRAIHDCAEIAEAGAAQCIGLTDASLVALARQLGTSAVATLDERHFRALRPLTGEAAFTLLPADADL